MNSSLNSENQCVRLRQKATNTFESVVTIAFKTTAAETAHLIANNLLAIVDVNSFPELKPLIYLCWSDLY